MGGSNGLGNLQALCLGCNQGKGARTADYRDPERHAAGDDRTMT